MAKYSEKFLIKNIIKRVIKSNQYQFKTQVYLLDKHWKKIVGSRLYPLCMPHNIYKKRLYINCRHQGLVQTLQFYKKDILDKIKTLYTEGHLLEHIDIDDIRFSYGNVNHAKQSLKAIKKEVKPDQKNKQDDSFEHLKQSLNIYFSRCTPPPGEENKR